MSPGRVALDDYDLALLSDGPDLAVTLALVSLDLRGIVDCGQEVVHQLVDAGSFSYTSLRNKPPKEFEPTSVCLRQPPPAGLDPIERAVYDAVASTPATAGNLGAIRDDAVRSPAVQAARVKLGRLGFPRRPEGLRAAMTRRSRWLLAGLVGVPVAGLLAVLAAGLDLSFIAEPVGFALFMAFGFRRDLVGLSMRGAPDYQVLRDARTGHPRPKLASNDLPLGRVPELGLLLALHGERVLWDFDPALALALSLPRPLGGGLRSGRGDLDFGDGDGCDGCGCD